MEQTGTRKNSKLLYGILAYGIIFLALLIISNLEPFNRFFGHIFYLLRPVIIGLALAYLLNPFFRLFERKLFYKVRPLGLRRTISLIFTYLVLIAIIAILILLIVPQLTDSILNFLDHSDSYLKSTVESINGLIGKLNTSLPPKADGTGLIPPIRPESISEAVSKLMSSIKLDGETLMGFLTAENVGAVMDMFGDLFKFMGDILFGLFISIYLLASKEKRYAQVLRWRNAFLGDTINSYITKVCTIADRSFGGFLRGKILDSSIIGVLVFLSISVLRVPYAVLIAVIIAITDIVPVIGPFIGVIPSAIIILLTDPTKVIPFLVCILVIQQIDGNIIAPKILGENTGVSSLCVMISITTLGSLWGLVGMILGVPLFATVLELTGEILDNRLRKKGLSTVTEDYYISGMTGEEHIPPAPESIPIEEASTAPTIFQNMSAISIYRLAVEHNLFSEENEEALAAFAADLAAMQQATETEPTLPFPEESETPEDSSEPEVTEHITSVLPEEITDTKELPEEATPGDEHTV